MAESNRPESKNRRYTARKQLPYRFLPPPLQFILPKAHLLPPEYHCRPYGDCGMSRPADRLRPYLCPALIPDMAGSQVFSAVMYKNDN